jgi:hypothetical protein
MKALMVGAGPQGRVVRGIRCAHREPGRPLFHRRPGAGQEAVAQAFREALAGRRTCP